MAECKWCDEEMLEVDGCSGNSEVEFPDGTKKPSIPFGREERYAAAGVPRVITPGTRCHDCGVLAGRQHHPGCDDEECPKCGGQLISCGCLDDEAGDEPRVLH